MFYYLLIGLFTISFIYELFLNVLEIRSSKRVTPDNVSDVYDNDTYLKKIYGDYMKLPPVEQRRNHMPLEIKFKESEVNERSNNP